MAGIVAHIEDIFDYRIILNNPQQLKKMKEEMIFKDDQLNNLFFYNPSDKIIKQNKHKNQFLPDAHSTVRMPKYNNTFEMFVHATSDFHTEKQGDQIYQIKENNIKNVYIIDSLIKNGYKGKFIRNEHDIYNYCHF